LISFLLIELLQYNQKKKNPKKKSTDLEKEKSKENTQYRYPSITSDSLFFPQSKLN